MRRGVLAVDRVLVLLLGLVLIVLGVAAIGWQVGFLADVWPDAPDEAGVDSTQVTDSSAFVAIASPPVSSWSCWACGGCSRTCPAAASDRCASPPATFPGRSPSSPPRRSRRPPTCWRTTRASSPRAAPC